ncbi:hypothetical protein [Arthrobacter sp. ES3-54]|uniref:hypothetical protein n=1 Tax=Arthrobacter sp. ES3-54 TaxID=1502991 RepID=UPI002407663F|nr:hypothetical protein [Arthrobacter sp. ES3-54]MDF9748632.1 hypothetical protein [Arthrobacter sp. ES3-54]
MSESKEVIPDEAVEAAYGVLPHGAGVYVTRDDLRVILEAAAPHLASVGDEAFGYAVSALRGHAEMTTAEAEAAVGDILDALGLAK